MPEFEVRAQGADADLRSCKIWSPSAEGIRAGRPVKIGAATALDCERMNALIDFTASSFETRFPSPFGSAIYDCRTGRLLSQAYDTVMESFDPTNHAEMNAIRLATQSLKQLSLRGCVLYSTCEPCPMCMSACLWTELACVVYGASTMEDANLYWPQASDVTPQELVSHALIDTDCVLVPCAERAACQELFRRCDEIRRQQGLGLPPHR